MTKAFEARIIREGTIDTRSYRYTIRETRDALEIVRLPIDALDTTAAIDGWEIIKRITTEGEKPSNDINTNEEGTTMKIINGTTYTAIAYIYGDDTDAQTGILIHDEADTNHDGDLILGNGAELPASEAEAAELLQEASYAGESCWTLDAAGIYHIGPDAEEGTTPSPDPEPAYSIRAWSAAPESAAYELRLNGTAYCAIETAGPALASDDCDVPDECLPLPIDFISAADFEAAWDEIAEGEGTTTSTTALDAIASEGVREFFAACIQGEDTTPSPDPEAAEDTPADDYTIHISGAEAVAIARAYLGGYCCRWIEAPYGRRLGMLEDVTDDLVSIHGISSLDDVAEIVRMLPAIGYPAGTAYEIARTHYTGPCYCVELHFGGGEIAASAESPTPEDIVPICSINMSVGDGRQDIIWRKSDGQLYTSADSYNEPIGTAGTFANPDAAARAAAWLWSYRDWAFEWAD